MIQIRRQIFIGATLACTLPSFSAIAAPTKEELSLNDKLLDIAALLRADIVAVEFEKQMVEMIIQLDRYTRVGGTNVNLIAAANAYLDARKNLDFLRRAESQPKVVTAKIEEKFRNPRELLEARYRVKLLNEYEYGLRSAVLEEELDKEKMSALVALKASLATANDSFDMNVRTAQKQLDEYATTKNKNVAPPAKKKVPAKN